MDKARKLELFAAQVRLLTDVPMTDPERIGMAKVMHGIIDQANDEAIATQQLLAAAASARGK